MAAQTKLNHEEIHLFSMCGRETSLERKPTKRSWTNSPSFESVLALASNEAAAKNSTTTPMAAPAMSTAGCGFCRSSPLPPPNPPPSCLPSPLHHFYAGGRLQETDQLIWQNRLKKRSPFLFHSFCMLVLLFSLWCQQAKMKEVGKGY
jgi:hypothetical protein